MLLLRLLAYFIASYFTKPKLLGTVLQKLWMFRQSPVNISGICGFVKLLLLRQTGFRTEDLPSTVSIAPGFACDTAQIV